MKLLYMRRDSSFANAINQESGDFLRGVDELVRSDENEHLAG
jgi:hypothetical protein